MAVRTVRVVVALLVATTVVPLAPVAGLAAAHPCAAGPAPMCPPPPTDGGASCYAAPVFVTDGTMFASTREARASAAFPVGSARDEQLVGDPGLPMSLGWVRAAWTECDAAADPVQRAAGRSRAGSVRLALAPLGAPVTVEAEGLFGAASSQTTSGTLEGDAGRVTLTRAGQSTVISTNVPANTRVAQGGVEAIVNARWTLSDAACRRDAAAAMYLIVPAAGRTYTVAIGFAATIACRAPSTVHVTSSPSGGPLAPGTAVSASTTVGGTGPTPDGQASFFLCNPATVTANGGDCRAGGTLISTRTLIGGSATSATTSATSVAGTYCWRAAYAGNALYLAGAGAGAGDACFTIARLTPRLDTTTQRQPDGRWLDVATVSGDGPTPTGVVSFFLCGPAEVSAAGCTAPAGAFAGSAVLDVTGTARSPAVAPAQIGTHCWRAQYGGDARYFPATHTNRTTECFDATQLAATVETSARQDGAGWVDDAVVSGGGPTPTGTVTFILCGPAEVTAAGCVAPAGGVVGVATLDASGAATSPPAAPSGDGRYCWRAEYSGDAVYLPASHTNATTECFDIGGVVVGATVQVSNFAFTPSVVTIAAGQAVRWTWVSGFHSVADQATNLEWCGARSGGPDCDREFPTPGMFDYYCGVHPFMTARVEVT